MASDGLVARLSDFHAELRRAGVGGPPTVVVDAVNALGHLDWHDREIVREALAATMITATHHREIFDIAFDLYFAPSSDRDDGAQQEPDERATAERATAERAAGDAGDQGHWLDDALIDAIVDAIVAGDTAQLARLVSDAVEHFGRVDSRDGTPAYFHYRVRRAIGADVLLARIAARVDDDAVSGPQPPAESGWLAAVDDIARRQLVDHLDALVAAEVRQRAAQLRGRQQVSRMALPASIEDRDLLSLHAGEQQQLRAVIEPLARRIATRMAARRRHGRADRVDVRRTVRKSLATGGVPFALVSRPRRTRRPELMVLCDVSGSVAPFARFTLLLVHSLQAQLGHVRTFAFIDELDEITASMDHHSAVSAIGQVGANANIVAADGHSDYGCALRTFLERFGDQLSSRTTILILGDARNNHRQANAWILQALHRRVRRIWWLNPEPRAFWDTGDSIASAYARHVDAMVEVRNVRQLAAAIERLG